MRAPAAFDPGRGCGLRRPVPASGSGGAGSCVPLAVPLVPRGVHHVRPGCSCPGPGEVTWLTVGSCAFAVGCACKGGGGLCMHRTTRRQLPWPRWGVCLICWAQCKGGVRFSDAQTEPPRRPTARPHTPPACACAGAPTPRPPASGVVPPRRPRRPHLGVCRLAPPAGERGRAAGGAGRRGRRGGGGGGFIGPVGSLRSAGGGDGAAPAAKGTGPRLGPQVRPATVCGPAASLPLRRAFLLACSRALGGRGGGGETDPRARSHAGMLPRSSGSWRLGRRCCRPCCWGESAGGRGAGGALTEVPVADAHPPSLAPPRTHRAPPNAPLAPPPPTHTHPHTHALPPATSWSTLCCPS